jgi:cobalt-zinc-cadmium efflux system protein
MTDEHHDHGGAQAVDGPHRHRHGANERRTFWAAILTCGFMLVEAAGGLIAGSLALLADAAHMLTDGVALALAWIAFRLARRPADHSRTYGFDRFQILVAFGNGITLMLLVAWIAYEAVDRFFAPVEVLGGPMLAVAVAGLLVNVVAFVLLQGADRNNLNIRGAMLHVLGDLLGSVAAILAAGVILLTGWTPIDPLLSLLVVLLIVRSAWKLVREAAHILLEGAPSAGQVGAIERDLVATIGAVEDVHHVHVWSLTQERPVVTLHARVAPGTDTDAVTGDIVRRLRERHGVGHATVQVEYARCADRTQ